MKIAFDSQIFTMQRYGGVSRYLVRLAEAINGGGHEARIFGKWYVNEYLAESAKIRDSQMVRISAFPRRTRRLLHHYNDFIASRRMASWGCDLIHESYFGERKVGPKKLPRVCTVHDMIDERMSGLSGERCRATKLKREAVERSDHVICISQRTKDDLMDIFGVDGRKISVVHHGSEWLTEAHKQNLEGIRGKIKEGGRPYFLYVGQRNHYKNFKILAEAFAASEQFKKDFEIRLFGGPELSPGELEMFDELGLPPGIVTHESGSDLDLAILYRGAVAFVYPSTYEGFGLPPLEAMTQGCPVIASSSAPMPEVIGPAAEFFDPGSVEDHLRSLNKVAFSSDRREELIKLGYGRVREFSWERCARETVEAYRRLW